MHQAFLNALKIEDLSLIFQELSNQEDLENNNLAQMLSTLVSCKAFMETKPIDKKNKANKEAFEQFLEEREDEDPYEETEL